LIGAKVRGNRVVGRALAVAPLIGPLAPRCHTMTGRT